MSEDMDRAAELLTGQGYTCVLCRDSQVYTSRQRGVKPLLELLDSGADLSGFSAADKVVGKAAAFLYVLLGVRSVYAPVISGGALQVLTAHGISLRFDRQVQAILNHRQDGLCPMETATGDITDPQEALAAIRRTRKALQAAGGSQPTSQT